MARPVVRNTVTANLRSVTQAFTSSTMDRICAGALDPIKAQTQANARALRDSTHSPAGGHLDQGIAVSKIKANGPRRTFWVGFRRRARKIAHLVEFGTAPHWQPHRFGGIMHPGATPKPFFRPAFEAKKAETLHLFGALAWAVIVRRLSGIAKV